MILRNSFFQSSEFTFQNNIFNHRDPPPNREFETLYLSLREKENRVYADEIVKNLPQIPTEHPLQKEWQFRKFSSQRLIRYLNKKNKSLKILELGCGNGWMCNQLASIPDSEVVGVDINEQELRQAARVFGKRQNITFVYGDILTISSLDIQLDSIILSSSIQYFKDPDPIFRKLFGILSENGEIHVLDSPIYQEKEIQAAEIRSRKYFEANESKLGEYYHHHSWESLAKLNYTVLFDPKTITNRIIRLFKPVSPFPWLRFRK